MGPHTPTQPVSTACVLVMSRPYCSPSVPHPCPLLSCTQALGVHPMTGSLTTLFLWDARTLVGISKNNSFLPPGRRFCQQLSKHRFYGVINTARDKLLSRLFKVSLLLSVVWAHRPGKEAALTGRPQAWQRAGARRLHLSGTPPSVPPGPVQGRNESGKPPWWCWRR